MLSIPGFESADGRSYEGSYYCRARFHSGRFLPHSSRAGGRQAITEAERYPADYNAILAGASAIYNMSIHAARLALNVMVHRSPESYIPPEKYAVVHQAVLDACDLLDGVKDGVLEDPMRCHFDPTVLACKGADSPSCLTSTQVETMRALYAPIKGIPGAPPLLQPGTELGWATFRRAARGEGPAMRLA